MSILNDSSPDSTASMSSSSSSSSSSLVVFSSSLAVTEVKDLLSAPDLRWKNLARTESIFFMRSLFDFLKQKQISFIHTFHLFFHLFLFSFDIRSEEHTSELQS